ncbi:MAG: phosphoribosyltransferase family protein [Actinomycetota bacterium]|nr:phosphoribosyltransferase family protein [Actinomycetota bacterium]
MFRDRHDAGRQLAEELARFVGASDVVVLGIPRGGVVVGEEIARRLELPLDIIVTSKIGAPGNPEYAVGAVDPDGAVIANPYAGYSTAELEHLGRSVRETIERRVQMYRSGRDDLDLEGKTVILVDDGIATGLTAMAAVEYIYRHGAKEIVLAVPVIASDTADRLEEMVDELITVEEPDIFYAVGQFYRSFEQTSDDEVLSALAGR